MLMKIYKKNVKRMDKAILTLSKMCVRQSCCECPLNKEHTVCLLMDLISQSHDYQEGMKDDTD